MVTWSTKILYVYFVSPIQTVCSTHYNIFEFTAVTLLDSIRQLFPQSFDPFV